MKVSTTQPFQIIYSLFQHEYLGYLFESFVVQLDEKGRLSFAHQNISSKNAEEFAKGLDHADFELIELMDSMQQESVIKLFYKKKIKAEDFFFKVYDKEKGNLPLQEKIQDYLETLRARILERLHGKLLFEMSNDGEPVGKPIEVMSEKASVLFHFRRNEDNTHYFPTIKYAGEKLNFQYQDAFLVCNKPAWMVLNGKLYHFKKNVDGLKLKPFLFKKFIVIPKKVEETYFKKFVAPLVASFDVYAKGFTIHSESYQAVPQVTFSELVASSSPQLFDSQVKEQVVEENKILFELSFLYGDYRFDANQSASTNVYVEKIGEEYIFHKIRRDVDFEKELIDKLQNTGLHFHTSRLTLSKSQAFSWLATQKEFIEKEGIRIQQINKGEKRYFLGQSSINIEVRENIDWFDIHAVVRFGNYEIPFLELREKILAKQHEIILPNGEIAVIPEVWFKEYSELFAFMEEKNDNANGELSLRKHHLSLIQELENGELARVTMNRKLQKLRGFEEIDEYLLPEGFKGELRPYQKAGYNWLRFLNQYKFGGCLADDMGLGKTVQTLAMLQAEKQKGNMAASLLVMPTSLIYNWEMEASKFTPELKVLVYTGTMRQKDPEQFKNYDLVLTSYGITRLDKDILKSYAFNYIILDESQAIKNPGSNIAKAVKELNSKNRLILTGTPLENSTLDLWSQMTFINPGLLGSQPFFRNEFLLPIEKKHDEQKTNKLYSIIKPFILRRHKSQVATELPEKVENIQYCTMTEAQEEKYEEARSFYRDKILESIEAKGRNNSQLLLLQGLTRLRQIANHPLMVEEDYQKDSGKLDNMTRMLRHAIKEGHKVLIFSQFVKHLTIVKNFLQEEGVDYAYLDGATKNRKGQVERFQNDENLKIFLISLKAGGLGLNLTKADYVFILDPWWNPAIEAQAVDRAHRIGQQNKVFTYKFITKDSVEEKILALQRSKLKLANELITTEESFVKNLTNDDIMALLD
ncbi:DEAD/DEAH box helicase [Xanthovirga aplysinae]|uniref:DEAD/DEAH box helicase n=1 Tax=Xanthovirga aplysinae TaxID=2529853 RepID=UPI0012BD78E7|nr:DEAD/DEAH box helicase [Xanthovirga aplysinae]MTI32205.1 DEAD/DEAH box helicase [Xanthovirga aplysinae]